LSAPLLVDQVTFTEAPVFVNCLLVAMTPLGTAGGSKLKFIATWQTQNNS
jgi:hypothetical protein